MSRKGSTVSTDALFAIIETPITAKPLSEPLVRTPVGSVALSGFIGGVALNAKTLTSAVAFEGGTCLFRWEQPNAFRAELLLTQPSYPLNMRDEFRVDACWVGFWKVLSLADNVSCRFRCEWLDREDGLDVSSDPGDSLAMMTWSRAPGGCRIALGTEDSQGLETRLGRSIPGRWKKVLADSEWSGGRVVQPLFDERSETGLELNLPSLAQGESCQTHFAVAWKAQAFETDIATSVAIDTAPWERVRVVGDCLYEMDQEDFDSNDTTAAHEA